MIKPPLRLETPLSRKSEGSTVPVRGIGKKGGERKNTQASFGCWEKFSNIGYRSFFLIC